MGWVVCELLSTQICGTMDVPKRTVEVFIAAAASVVSVSGQKGGCAIHICRTPDASTAAIVFTVAAAFVPSMTSPTRSRVGGRLGETCKPESFVTLSPPVLFAYPFPELPHYSNI